MKKMRGKMISKKSSIRVIKKNINKKKTKMPKINYWHKRMTTRMNNNKSSPANSLKPPNSALYLLPKPPNPSKTPSSNSSNPNTSNNPNPLPNLPNIPPNKPPLNQLTNPYPPPPKPSTKSLGISLRKTVKIFSSSCSWTCAFSFIRNLAMKISS
jgi:hypothetical protein